MTKEAVLTHYKPTVAVDFDGTIVEEHDHHHALHLKPGVREALQKLRDAGCDIVIYSCRTNGGRSEADKLHQIRFLELFLTNNEIPFDRIDDGRFGKIFAHWYIDNRAIEYKDNWEQIADRLTDEKNSGKI